MVMVKKITSWTIYLISCPYVRGMMFFEQFSLYYIITFDFSSTVSRILLAVLSFFSIVNFRLQAVYMVAPNIISNSEYSFHILENICQYYFPPKQLSTQGFCFSSSELHFPTAWQLVFIHLLVNRFFLGDFSARFYI